MNKIILSCMVLSAFVVSAALPDVASAQQRRSSRITITSPYPYDTLKKGSTVRIKWAGYVSGDLNFYYRNKETGRRTLVRENISPRSEIRWTIPASLADGEYDLILEEQSGSARHTTQVKLKGETIKWNSQVSERINLRNPNGGETYEFGEPIRIEWDHGRLGNNRLELFVGAQNPNGKIVWTPIASNIPGNWDGYTWYPDQDELNRYLRQQHVRGTPRYKILISDKLNQNAKDTSDGTFTIR